MSAGIHMAAQLDTYHCSVNTLGLVDVVTLYCDNDVIWVYKNLLLIHVSNSKQFSLKISFDALLTAYNFVPVAL